MARRKGEPPKRGGSVEPTQQDDADIVNEVGAQRDEDTGELVADEARVAELGAADVESVHENRRMRRMTDRRRGGEKGVHFNVADVIAKYDLVTKTWPPNTLYISMIALTGSPVQYMIRSFPKNGVELYEAIQQHHGRREETRWSIKVVDASNKQYRANGEITMPDTRDSAPNQPYSPYGSQQPYQQPQFAPPYGAPPSYPPQHPYPQPFPQSPYGAQSYAGPPSPPTSAPASAPVQPPPPPVIQVTPPPALDPNQMFGWMQQMFQMFQQMQSRPADPSAVQPPPPPMAYSPVPPPPPPPAPSQTDPNAMLAWMSQMFQMFQQAQASAVSRGPAPDPGSQPQAPNPAAMMAALGMPPVTPPPGMIFVPGLGFVPIERLMQAMADSVSGPPGPYRPTYRSPYRAPPYGGGGEPAPPPFAAPPVGPPVVPAQRSAKDQIRESMDLLRSAVEFAQDFASVIPGQQQQPPQAEPYNPDNDNPIRTIDAGGAKILVNKEDGRLRGWETGWANIDKIFKFVGEQAEVFRRSSAERSAAPQQPPRQQLPPGIVEVTPGYQPPPGYVVGPPIDPRQIPQGEALPSPPAQMPPPMQAAPTPEPTRPAWGPPTFPGES